MTYPDPNASGAAVPEEEDDIGEGDPGPVPAEPATLTAKADEAIVRYLGPSNYYQVCDDEGRPVLTLEAGGAPGRVPGEFVEKTLTHPNENFEVLDGSWTPPAPPEPTPEDEQKP